MRSVRLQEELRSYAGSMYFSYPHQSEPGRVAMALRELWRQ